MIRYIEDEEDLEKIDGDYDLEMINEEEINLSNDNVEIDDDEDTIIFS